MIMGSDNNAVNFERPLAPQTKALDKFRSLLTVSTNFDGTINPAAIIKPRDSDLVFSRKSGSPKSAKFAKGFKKFSLFENGVVLKTGMAEKPPYSYATLIAAAIQNSQDQRMTLNDIYSWIQNNFPFYRTAKSGWKNAIRHNLSLNKVFVRLPRPMNEPGRGAYWSIDPTCNPLDIYMSSSPRAMSPYSGAFHDEKKSAFSREFSARSMMNDQDSTSLASDQFQSSMAMVSPTPISAYDSTAQDQHYDYAASYQPMQMFYNYQMPSASPISAVSSPTTPTVQMGYYSSGYPAPYNTWGTDYAQKGFVDPYHMPAANSGIAATHLTTPGWMSDGHLPKIELQETKTDGYESNAFEAASAKFAQEYSLAGQTLPHISDIVAGGHHYSKESYGQLPMDENFLSYSGP